MRFRLLGPVEVSVEARSVPLGPPQRLAVLAALLVDCGHVVPVDVLIDRVWGEAPPPGARSTLYSHVSRLRTVLLQTCAQAGAVAALKRLAGGYAFQVDRDRVDLHRFQRLLEEARDTARPAPTRLTQAREALQLWSGVPLAGVPGEWAERIRSALLPQRSAGLVVWAQLELELGNRDVVIERLSAAISAEPINESMSALLMRALHQAGRGAEALRVHEAIRTRLRDELGVDPGPELRATYAALLRSDVPPVRLASAPALPAVPAQLPADVSGFTGREAELGHLDALLARSTGEPRGVIIAAISGAAGVGKTTLAVHWARRASARFPDGQLYANLGGFGPAGSQVEPTETLGRFLHAFQVDAATIPTDLTSRIGMYRSLLDGRRVLIVLDNAADAEQVRPLLPGAPGCLVIVTSRSRLISLVTREGAFPLAVDLLGPAEARQFLVRRLGQDRVASDPAATDLIVGRCAGLPLALALVSARAAIAPNLPLTVFADELGQSSRGLEPFAADDTDIDLQVVFSWSYRRLGAATARLFRLLGLHPGPDFDTTAAASLAGLDVDSVRGPLDELARTHMIEQRSVGRYTLHDLVRAYAETCADTEDGSDDRQAARHRLLNHYLCTAIAADRHIYPHRESIQPIVSQVVTEPPADRTHALAWFAAELPCLLGAVDSAAEHGLDAHAWQLAWALTTFLNRQGYWHEWAATQRTGLAAADRVGDPTGQAYSYRNLGNAQTRLGQYEAAEGNLRRALDLFGSIGDRVAQAGVRSNLAWLAERQGRLRTALAHEERALDLRRAAGLESAEASSLNAIGWYHGLLGDSEQAIAYCNQALRIFQRFANPYGEAYTWDSLAHVYQQLGDHRRMVDCSRRGIDLCHDIGEQYLQARLLHRLGDAQAKEGDLDAARAAWCDALEILHVLDQREAAIVATKLRDLTVE